MTLLAALAFAGAGQGQVGVAPGTGGAGIQPAGDAGNVGVQPAGGGYVQPQDGAGGGDDLAAVDYGDPPELGDVNIRVPLTLENLHADIAGWSLRCEVRSGSDYSTRMGSGEVSGTVDNGSFSGPVIVPIDLPEQAAPQDIRNYRCLVSLIGSDGQSVMIKDDDVDSRFRALPGSTTYRHRFMGPNGGRRQVVGVRADWRIE